MRTTGLPVAGVNTALDIEDAGQLAEWLRAKGWLGAHEALVAEVLAGGVSNRTVLVRRAAGPAWVLKQALPKLRVPTDWFSSPARVHREALGLRWLPQLAPPDSTPRFVFEDPDEHLLAMEAVPQPHANWKTLLLAGEVAPDLFAQCGQLLGTLHRAAWQRRAELAEVFAERAFFESLRLAPYYAYAAEHVPPAAAFLRALIDRTRACALTLVHGDYSPKNLLVYRSRLILLDHEVIHWGDPAFDLGFALTHFLSKAHHLPGRRAALTDASRAWWRAYNQTLGALPWRADLEGRAVAHTLGCLLARVAGRSPLEYLTPAERGRQQAVVTRLLDTPPATIPDLITAFTACIESTD